MRLIDADALQDECVRLSGREMPVIESAPTVDAVKVVRCKNCKHAHLTYSKSCKYCDMWKDDDDFFLRLYLPPDFYCAYGERREDETD